MNQMIPLVPWFQIGYTKVIIIIIKRETHDHNEENMNWFQHPVMVCGKKRD